MITNEDLRYAQLIARIDALEIAVVASLCTRQAANDESRLTAISKLRQMHELLAVHAAPNLPAAVADLMNSESREAIEALIARIDAAGG